MDIWFDSKLGKLAIMVRFSCTEKGWARYFWQNRENSKLNIVKEVDFF